MRYLRPSVRALYDTTTLPEAFDRLLVDALNTQSYTYSLQTFCSNLMLKT